MHEIKVAKIYVEWWWLVKMSHDSS